MYQTVDVNPQDKSSLVIIQLIQFCEREGLDPSETFGPDLEGCARELIARGEAYEREEMQRDGKLL